MNFDEKYMLRCLELAKDGFGNVAPNPMVGCVIVCEGKIIGEGYHQEYGKAHAEVNAIHSVRDKSLLQKSTLYVNLEPCAHFGKTPPCANLIVEHNIPRVVIGCVDSYSEVSGKGIEKLRNAGIEVTVGILENESLELNKRFFYFSQQKTTLCNTKMG
jgi:diaminohydroxyphosphoribosylaminopyrimidine deaminase/5-amino-6-(5-phosphoribosylamino)uracil reductase